MHLKSQCFIPLLAASDLCMIYIDDSLLLKAVKRGEKAWYKIKLSFFVGQGNNPLRKCIKENGTRNS